MSNYHRYSNNGPMSDWGHAMFAKGNPFRCSHYGRNHYTFDGNAPHISTLLDAIKTRIMVDVDNGYSNLDCEEFDALAIDEENVDELVALYNPQDIVNTAGAWDNGYLVAAAFDALDTLGIYAVLLDDGAIVFDPALIRQVEYVESDESQA